MRIVFALFHVRCEARSKLWRRIESPSLCIGLSDCQLHFHLRNSSTESTNCSRFFLKSQTWWYQNSNPRNGYNRCRQQLLFSPHTISRFLNNSPDTVSVAHSNTLSSRSLYRTHPRLFLSMTVLQIQYFMCRTAGLVFYSAYWARLAPFWQ